MEGDGFQRFSFEHGLKLWQVKDLKDTSRTAVAPSESDHRVTSQMEALLLSNFLNPKYSDLTITCRGEVFPAHRNIVCPQSEFFQACCDGSFKERGGEIELDDDPTLVKKTLEFLYTGNYTYEAPPEDPEMEPLSKAESELSEDEAEPSIAHPRTGEACFHAQMYAHGEYLGISALKREAKRRFKNSLMRDPDRDSFASAVREVYSSTAKSDRGLRDLAVQLTTSNLSLLRRRETPILDENLLEDVPSFMRDICLSAVEKCAEFQRADRGRGGHNRSEVQFGGTHYD